MLLSVMYTKRRKQKRRSVSKRTFGHVRRAKILTSVRLSAVWSESSRGAFGIAKDGQFLHTNNEDSDRTAR